MDKIKLQWLAFVGEFHFIDFKIMKNSLSLFKMAKSYAFVAILAMTITLSPLKITTFIVIYLILLKRKLKNFAIVIYIVESENSCPNLSNKKRIWICSQVKILKGRIICLIYK